MDRCYKCHALTRNGVCDICFMADMLERMWKSKNMSLTPDDLYEKGYEDGKAGKAMNASYMTESNYTMGYEDGKGDHKIEAPSADEFTAFNDPPDGFEFTGEKRVPEPFEYYLSKNGNATYLERARKNKQTRHILRCMSCKKSRAYEYDYGCGMSCTHHHEVKGRG